MTTLTSADGVRIHLHTWSPPVAPRAVVQIAHGMGEHARRYAPLAEALAARGFAVVADDHRGHGLSMHAGPGVLGEDGWNRLVDDLAMVSAHARAAHPYVPLVLLGHSLGSFAAQQYLLDHVRLVDAAVLCGTTALDGLFAHLATQGPDVMAAFNRPFEPARTAADWLSRDEAQVDAYLADPMCGFTLDDRAMGELAAAAARLTEPAGIPAGLPLYVMVGDRDPLNAGLALSDLLVERYGKAGLMDITYRPYPGARHELFNETNRTDVVADLVEWLDRVV
ncbi:alpha/beta fold hydrolase [Streptomyces sp. NRRL B-24484]|uniref:alpha/beta fold hydrolase n=1 Tax=Streptomyces sp. NRRL B-24484 TaxID=1463833 RepID=UPI0004BEC382|nr:alpha/beta fold hydrolase [Streptomyces sp. NRRL B-24484]